MKKRRKCYGIHSGNVVVWLHKWQTEGFTQQILRQLQGEPKVVLTRERDCDHNVPDIANIGCEVELQSENIYGSPVFQKNSNDLDVEAELRKLFGDSKEESTNVEAAQKQSKPKKPKKKDANREQLISLFGSPLDDVELPHRPEKLRMVSRRHTLPVSLKINEDILKPFKVTQKRKSTSTISSSPPKVQRIEVSQCEILETDFCQVSDLVIPSVFCAHARVVYSRCEMEGARITDPPCVKQCNKVTAPNTDCDIIDLTNDEDNIATLNFGGIQVTFEKTYLTEPSSDLSMPLLDVKPVVVPQRRPPGELDPDWTKTYQPTMIQTSNNLQILPVQNVQEGEKRDEPKVEFIPIFPEQAETNAQPLDSTDESQDAVPLQSLLMQLHEEQTEAERRHSTEDRTIEAKPNVDDLMPQVSSGNSTPRPRSAERRPNSVEGNREQQQLGSTPHRRCSSPERRLFDNPQIAVALTPKNKRSVERKQSVDKQQRSSVEKTPDSERRCNSTEKRLLDNQEIELSVAQRIRRSVDRRLSVDDQQEKRQSQEKSPAQRRCSSTEHTLEMALAKDGERRRSVDNQQRSSVEATPNPQGRCSSTEIRPISNRQMNVEASSAQEDRRSVERRQSVDNEKRKTPETVQNVQTSLPQQHNISVESRQSSENLVTQSSDLSHVQKQQNVGVVQPSSLQRAQCSENLSLQELLRQGPNVQPNSAADSQQRLLLQAFVPPQKNPTENRTSNPGIAHVEPQRGSTENRQMPQFPSVLPSQPPSFQCPQSQPAILPARAVISQGPPNVELQGLSRSPPNCLPELVRMLFHPPPQCREISHEEFATKIQPHVWNFLQWRTDFDRFKATSEVRFVNADLKETHGKFVECNAAFMEIFSRSFIMDLFVVEVKDFSLQELCRLTSLRMQINMYRVCRVLYLLLRPCNVLINTPFLKKFWHCVVVTFTKMDERSVKVNPFTQNDMYTLRSQIQRYHLINHWLSVNYRQPTTTSSHPKAGRRKRVTKAKNVNGNQSPRSDGSSPQRPNECGQPSDQINSSQAAVAQRVAAAIADAQRHISQCLSAYSAQRDAPQTQQPPSRAQTYGSQFVAPSIPQGQTTVSQSFAAPTSQTTQSLAASGSQPQRYPPCYSQALQNLATSGSQPQWNVPQSLTTSASRQGAPLAVQPLVAPIPEQRYVSSNNCLGSVSATLRSGGPNNSQSQRDTSLAVSVSQAQTIASEALACLPSQKRQRTVAQTLIDSIIAGCDAQTAQMSAPQTSQSAAVPNAVVAQTNTSQSLVVPNSLEAQRSTPQSNCEEAQRIVRQEDNTNARRPLPEEVGLALEPPVPESHSCNNGNAAVEEPAEEKVLGAAKSEDGEVIDLTWIEDGDEMEILEEVIECKIFPFKAEVVPSPREVASPTDSGLGSPSREIDSSLQCLCGNRAKYVCACSLSVYCSNDCQVRDWVFHQRMCTSKKQTS